MSDRPLVSVIIPNYNYARTLSACIEAVQRQTYPAIEIIVADDASTDDSVAIARRMNVTVLEGRVNKGVSSARNRGADHANGDVLFFVDSDVALEADAVEKAVDILLREPGLGAVCGMYLAEPMFPDSLVKPVEPGVPPPGIGRFSSTCGSTRSTAPFPACIPRCSRSGWRCSGRSGRSTTGCGGRRSRTTASGSTPATRCGPCHPFAAVTITTVRCG